MCKLFTALLLALTTTLTFAYSEGPPDGMVGRGDVCNRCHNSFALNSGGGTLQVEGLPLGVYEPDKEYVVAITEYQAGQSRYGFEASFVLQRDEMKRAGETRVLENDLTQISSAGGTAPQYIKHRKAGTFAGIVQGTAYWEFVWKAPPAGTGNVVMYVAANAASNDNLNQGDYIYTKTIRLSEKK